jgi:hypothetical protein
MDQVMTMDLPAKAAEYTTWSHHEYSRTFFSKAIDPWMEGLRKEIASTQTMQSQEKFQCQRVLLLSFSLA